MCRFLSSLPLIIFWLALTGLTFPQEKPIPENIWKEAGFPYIQNFSPKDYGENPQNWTILQDERGIMYFGNTHGLLIYDGVSWRLIKTATGYVVRSLRMLNGRIYVGGQNDLGYLAANAAGELQYISLMNDIPEQYHDFQDVWQTAALGGKIYFQTVNYIFRFSEGRVNVWSNRENPFLKAFPVNDQLYVYQRGKGLARMADDSLRIAPGGERFADNRVQIILPFDDSQLLIGTREGGLFLYDGSSFTLFPTGADNLLRQNRLYCGEILSGGLIALGTLNGGLVIIDKSGNLCQVLNKASGLRDERIYAIAPDREGGVWLAMNNGIARVEIPSPLTRFDAASGIENIVESVLRYREKLFIGTHAGVYYLDSREVFPRFKPVKGITLFAWWLEEMGNKLVAATTEGICEIEEDRATLIQAGWTGVRSIIVSQKHPNRLYVGLHDGLAALQLENGRWIDLGRVPGVSERMFDITEDKDGTLWLGTQYQGVIRAEISSPAAPFNANGEIRITRFGKEQGVPEGQISAATVKGEVALATYTGLKKFDPRRQVFIADSTFGEMFADSTTEIFRVREDERGNIWFTVLKQKKQIIGRAVPHPEQPGKYLWQETPFLRLNDIGHMFTIYPEKNGVVWFGGSEGLARYTPDVPKNYAAQYSAIIRKVGAISSDTVYYHGATPSEMFQPVLDYGHNSLRFEFAAPSYDDISVNQYQFMLENFDENWSRWTRENRKDYTGLPAGDYVFKVRAKNIYENLSGEARFEFTVLPPWYRSPWLYFIYALLAAGLIFGLVKIRVRQLERKSHELEKIVAERTAQVVEQRNQLKAQSDKLQEMDRLKSRFFANISHEFRTPLTLIMGLLDKFIDKTKNGNDLSDYQVIKRNAARLLQLINQLLDLAKLEAGGEKLRAARGDIVRFVRRIILSFSSLGEQKSINLFFNGAPLTAEMGHAAIYVYFDPDKLEKVFYNLLSNAFKFTPKEGSIEVSVAVGSRDDLGFRIADLGLKDAESEVPNSRSQVPNSRSEIRNPKSEIVEVRVTNTGPGIPEEKLPYIFDRFYQADSDSTREFEGTGIGLALVKELVDLHHGEVVAQSVLNGETTFLVWLPLGRSHLKDTEIVEAEEMLAEETLPGFGLGVSGFELGVSSSEFPVTSIEHPTSSIEHRASSIEHRTSSIEQQTTDNEATIVLIVEDHPDLRLFIRENLGADYKIMEAENGKTGLEKAKEILPDLVISDIMMPEMDGYELCKRLKSNEKTSHIPIILLTAKAATEDKLEGLETGADDYLVKPFNPEELKVRVRNLIRLRQQMREKFSAEMLLKPSDVTVPSTQKIFLEKLTAAIEEHIDDEEFSVEMLGEKIGMSRVHLHRKIKAITNQSPSEFIRNFRLQRAAELIRQDAGNIAEIAYMVGFNSQAYFTRSFQEAFGCSPSEFKKRQKN